MNKKSRDVNGENRTESIFNEVIEGMAIAIISKLVIGSGKFLKTLCSDASEIAFKLRVLRENHSSSRHKAIDQ